tara:strand:- start:21024 stop:21302 length:279 start_codon:yes stop_codon:yes gene_type:complete
MTEAPPGQSNVVVHPRWKKPRSAIECLEEVLSLARHSTGEAAVKKVVVVMIRGDGEIDYAAGPQVSMPWVEIHGLLALAAQLCFHRNHGSDQ